MQRRVAFLLISLAPVLATATPQAQERIWITDATIVSPESLDHIAPASVLIENGRIARVERSTGATKPAGATVVSGKGQFLIPGLIDSHVHLASLPAVDPTDVKSNPGMKREYFQQLPRSYLYFGYTTLVDLAVTDHAVLENFRQAPLHPDLYECGESLPIANGYPMSFAPSPMRFKAFPNFIYDPQQAASIPSSGKRGRGETGSAWEPVQDRFRRTKNQ
jgi:hypothetical protein